MVHPMDHLPLFGRDKGLYPSIPTSNRGVVDFCFLSTGPANSIPDPLAQRFAFTNLTDNSPDSRDSSSTGRTVSSFARSSGLWFLGSQACEPDRPCRSRHPLASGLPGFRDSAHQTKKLSPKEA